ncbi:hypothetical protein Tco_0223573, partial [Tanacetum coccineum]
CTIAYDEPIGNLDKMGDEVENSSPQSTLPVLPSFEGYTPPMIYPKELEETVGIPMEEVPSFDEPEPQPQPLRNYPSLDVSLGEERGPE